MFSEGLFIDQQSKTSTQTSAGEGRGLLAYSGCCVFYLKKKIKIKIIPYLLKHQNSLTELYHDLSLKTKLHRALTVALRLCS